MSRPPPMISAKSLGAMPEFAIEQLGGRKTRKLMSSAGLSDKLAKERQGYIPEHALSAFVAGVSRELGVDHLGLLFAPLLTVADYGQWGEYVLAAPNLGVALQRAQQEMWLHSNRDRVEFLILGDLVSYSYIYGLRGQNGYPDIAYSAVASMLSIPRHFCGADWSPIKIEFNFPKDHNQSFAAETFGCPVSFDASRLSLFFAKSDLNARNPVAAPHRFVSRKDIILERGGPPEDFLRCVRAVIDVQIEGGGPSLEHVSHAMGIGPRTLQRRISKYGLNFRDLSTVAIMERAKDLLGSGSVSVVEVSEYLGYTEPGNFSRAFSKHFGCPPKMFIRHRQKSQP